MAGIVNLDGRPVESALLEVMLDSLAHRGTDGRGVWVDGKVGLGQVALWTTLEASLESLPMQLAGRVAITGDVRLDNREDLLALLPEHTFLTVTAPDSALVMAAYEKWGEACVEHFIGDFAFAIWDARLKKLFCARDQMGVKPFYYAVIPGRRFVFGTEIKAILSVPGVSDAVNELSVADSFVHVVNDPVSTFYSQVSRLPAAHSLSVASTVSTRRYWALNPDRELRLNCDQEYAEGFRELFSQAVRCRMRSSHPVGSMLSGGLDSSAVTCVARNFLKAQGKTKLHTFSAVFDEVSECDERPYIQTVLEQGHCEANFIVLDKLSPLSDAETIIWHLDEPLSAGNLYLNWNAYRNAKELGVRVVLDGFDGDTTVSHGLGLLAEMARDGRWLDLAVELRKVSITLDRKINGESWLPGWWSWYCRYHRGAHHATRLCRGAMRRIRRLSSPNTRSVDPMGFINPDLTRKLRLAEKAKSQVASHKNERERHIRLLQRDLLSRNLELLNHTSSAFQVEVRCPFMDIRLIEYCLSLPADQKLRGGWTRLVMRNGMAGILPEKIQRRGGKSNISPSFEKGVRKYERDNLGKVILGEAGQLAPYINLGRVKDCLDRFRHGQASEDDFGAIWRITGLALWLRGRRAETNKFILKRKEVKQP